MIGQILTSALQDEIVSFWRERRTGQVALNFCEGRILNHDIRDHVRSVAPFCASCALPRQNGNKWVVSGGKAYCGACAEKLPKDRA